MTGEQRRTFRSTPLRGLVALATLVVCSWTSRARAQETPPPTTPISNELRAEYLFRAGERKFDAGKYHEACYDFQESLRLGPKLGTLLNLALCHETIGRAATAWNEWNIGAVWATQFGQKDRHEFAMQHAQALETKVPRILLQLPAGQAIGSVEIDGEPLHDARWYLPIFVDPGEHSVSVSAPGKQRSTVKFRVILSPTEQLVTIPALVDEAPKPPPPPPQELLDPDAEKRTIGWIAIATGGGLVAAGLTFGALALVSRSDAADQCIGNRCTPDGVSSYESAQTRASVSTVMTLVGVGVIAGGAWLVLTSRKPTMGLRVGMRARADGGVDVGLGGSF